MKIASSSPGMVLSASIHRSMAIAARWLKGTHPTAAHLSDILRHPLAPLSAIRASYAIHVPRRSSFRPDSSIRRTLSAAANCVCIGGD